MANCNYPHYSPLTQLSCIFAVIIFALADSGVACYFDNNNKNNKQWLFRCTSSILAIVIMNFDTVQVRRAWRLSGVRCPSTAAEMVWSTSSMVPSARGLRINLLWFLSIGLSCWSMWPNTRACSYTPLIDSFFGNTRAPNARLHDTVPAWSDNHMLTGLFKNGLCCISLCFSHNPQHFTLTLQSVGCNPWSFG